MRRLITVKFSVGIVSNPGSFCGGQKSNVNTRRANAVVWAAAAIMSPITANAQSAPDTTGDSPIGVEMCFVHRSALNAVFRAQVVIVNQHVRQPPPQQQQMQPPPQLVIARPRGDGASPPGARSPQFPAIPPFVGAGASPLETPATSGQSQPQVRYHKQVSARFPCRHVLGALLNLAMCRRERVTADVIESWAAQPFLKLTTGYAAVCTCFASAGSTRLKRCSLAVNPCIVQPVDAANRKHEPPIVVSAVPIPLIQSATLASYHAGPAACGHRGGAAAEAPCGRRGKLAPNQQHIRPADARSAPTLS